MAKKKGNRVQVILECTEHKTSGVAGTSRYITTKNRKNTPERLEVIGPVRAAANKGGIERLRAKGVRFFGEMRQQDIVKRVSFWGCAVIPFLIDDMIDCVDPIKFYEYFAIGLPVVASSFKGMKSLAFRYEQFSRIGGPLLVDESSPAMEWAKRISAAIEWNVSDAVDDRKAWAKENTWDHRADYILEICNEL